MNLEETQQSIRDPNMKNHILRWTKSAFIKKILMLLTVYIQEEAKNILSFVNYSITSLW